MALVTAELHLRQSGFTHSICGMFTKHCERIQNFWETANLKHLYRNKLDKACFAHVGEENWGKNLKYDGYQRGLV